MQRNECKPGTEVIIRGMIKGDDRSNSRPINVTINRDDGKTENFHFFEPSTLEPSQPKYDPTRKFRTGDKVRFIHHGRRNYIVTPENGQECTVIENEKQEQVLIKCCGYTAVFHFADLELVKPVEEIEAEQPYGIMEASLCFRILGKGFYIHEIWWDSTFCPSSPYSKEEARKKAQELCDELNRKHQEPLNA